MLNDRDLCGDTCGSDDVPLCDWCRGHLHRPRGHRHWAPQLQDGRPCCPPGVSLTQCYDSSHVMASVNLKLLKHSKGTEKMQHNRERVVLCQAHLDEGTFRTGDLQDWRHRKAKAISLIPLQAVYTAPSGHTKRKSFLSSIINLRSLWPFSFINLQIFFKKCFFSFLITFSSKYTLHSCTKIFSLFYQHYFVCFLKTIFC